MHYHHLEYEEQTVEHLLEIYKQELLQILQHCLNKEETEATPSDFDAKDLSLEDLDEVFDLLESHK
ncbi:hypothetical protein [Caldalkalibacillus mannanilyticus]|uniref:hypothetical protein n=1 Tax=Caldalkalibacillus mannanilyticus TaxID=1418 RepID=UPI0034E2E82C